MDNITQLNNKLADIIHSLTLSHFAKKDTASDLEFYLGDKIIEGLHNKYDSIPNNKITASLRITEDGDLDICKVNESIIDFIDGLAYDNFF